MPTSKLFTDLLRAHGIQISMSRRGNPYDNALAESFLKTLKYEEVYRQDYRDLRDADQSIEHFVEQVYNEKRLHSALGYLPPAEFERGLWNWPKNRRSKYPELKQAQHLVSKRIAECGAGGRDGKN